MTFGSYSDVVTHFTDRKSTRLNSSHSLHDALPIYRNQQDKCALGLLEPAPHSVSFLRADDLWLVLGRGNALYFPGWIAAVGYQFAPRAEFVDQSHQSLQMIDRPVRQVVVALEFLEPVLNCVMRDLGSDLTIPSRPDEPLQMHSVSRHGGMRAGFQQVPLIVSKLPLRELLSQHSERDLWTFEACFVDFCVEVKPVHFRPRREIGRA